MANRKRGPGEVNRSALIREILDKNPDTSVKDVRSTLAERGIEVSSNLVYLIKSKMKAKTQRKRMRRAVQATKQAGLANPVQLVREVQQLGEKAGGMRHLKELVELLAK